MIGTRDGNAKECLPARGGLPPLLLVALAGIAVGAPAAELLRLPHDLFPVVEGFEVHHEFWTEVFGRHSSSQVVLHDENHLGVVYAVLDFSELEEAPALSEVEKRRRRQQEISRAEGRFRAVLLELAAGRQPAQREEAARLEELFASVPGGRDKYRAAVGSMRTQTGLRDRFAQAIRRAGRLLPEMEGIFARRGLPVELTRLPFVESMFQETARSKVGAGGVWQFMPASARGLLRSDLEMDERYDPLRATAAAAKVLEGNHRALGSWPLAITAYNSGLNGLARAVARLGTREPSEVLRRHESRIFGFASRNFYSEFLAAATIFANRAHYFPGVEPDSPLTYEEVVPDAYVAVRELAARAGADLEPLRELNPGLNPEVWSGNLLWPKRYPLRVPGGAGPAFESAYAALPATFKSEHQAGFRYRIRRGDTLSGIAGRFGTTVASLRRTNGLSGDFIREGQTLLIPPRASGSRPGVAPASVAESALAAAGVYVVKAGDTLWRIARSFRSCVEAIQAANNLDSRGRIYPGQKLRIPTSSSC